MSVVLHHGDALDVLRSLPSASVHCCVTSPPYFGLRDYGEAGQVGLERTPAEYVARLVDVFREVRRVLRDDGTFWLNLGDSYATTPTGNRGTKSSLHGAQTSETYQRTLDTYTETKRRRAAIPDGLKSKDLIGIPWRVAFALQSDGWYLRSDVIWHKPNPMPESVTDRPTKAHEYLFLLAKSPTYYYDADAVREQASVNKPWGARSNGGAKAAIVRNDGNTYDGLGKPADDAAGRNRRTVWTVATRPYKGAHFATFPPALVEPCILAGTSERGVCSACGAPWRRVTERTPMQIRRTDRMAEMGEFGRTQSSGTMIAPATSVTVGWEASCKCVAPTVPATVLDPFNGAGTTGLVASQHGRAYIGIDLNAGYLDLTRERLAKPSAPVRVPTPKRPPRPTQQTLESLWTCNHTGATP